MEIMSFPVKNGGSFDGDVKAYRRVDVDIYIYIHIYIFWIDVVIVKADKVEVDTTDLMLRNQPVDIR